MNEVLYLIVIILSLSAVILLYVRFFLWDMRKRKREMEEYVQQTKDFYNVVLRILGEQAVRNLKGDYYWEGMPEFFYMRYWGMPAKVSEIRRPGEVTRIYYYSPIENARRNARKKYRQEYHFRNRELVYWEVSN